VKLSEFERAIATEFGEVQGRVLLRDHVLVELGNRTGEEALAAGEPARAVWLALCRDLDVPRERWHGAGRPDPQR